MLSCRSFSFIIVVTLALSGCARRSEETWLRNQFKLEQNVQLLSESRTKGDPESELGLGKGQTLEGTFKFSPTQLIDYHKQIENDPEWRSLPIPDEMLTKMSNFSPLFASLPQALANPTSPDRTTNPALTKEQKERMAKTHDTLLRQFSRNIPKAAHGVYRCQTVPGKFMTDVQGRAIANNEQPKNFVLGVIDDDLGLLKILARER